MEECLANLPGPFGDPSHLSQAVDLQHGEGVKAGIKEGVRSNKPAQRRDGP